MNWDKMTVQGILAVGLCVAFPALVLLWMIRPPTGDASSIALLNALIMVVGSAFLSVIGYYYGSSSSSKDKEETNKALTDKIIKNGESDGTAHSVSTPDSGGTPAGPGNS